MPEINLYEYPLSAVPVDLKQPVTLLQLHPSVAQSIRSTLAAMPSYYQPPTRWMEPLLLANTPNILTGFKWEWNKRDRRNDMAPAIVVGGITSTEPAVALVHAWADIWRNTIRDTHLNALPQAESLLGQIARLWKDGELLDISTCLLSDVILRADASLNNAAYTLVPAMLLRQLLGQQTPLVGGQSAIWELVVGRDETYAVSQLLRADNDAPFAYKLEAELQTFARSQGEEPVIHLKLKQQRYPDGGIVNLPQKTPSVLLRTAVRHWCKVSFEDYGYVLRREAAVGATALPAWDALPDLESLQGSPERYMDLARIVYLTGMTYRQHGEASLHPLQVGMSFEEIHSVLEPIVQRLELDTNTQVEPDSQLANLLASLGRKSATRSIWALDRLKRSKTSDPTETLRERIMVSTDNKGLEIVVVSRRSHSRFIREFLPAALNEIFGVEPQRINSDLMQILPNVTCRVIQLSATEAALFEPLDYAAISGENQDGTRSRRMERWRPAYKQRYQDLLNLLQSRLPTEGGVVRFALIDKPIPSSGHIAKWEDAKGVARAAFAELGYLTQFINPYHPRKDGTEYIPRDTPHRVRQGLLDGFRQLGVVLGEPAKLYELMGLPAVDVISAIIIQTQYRDIQYPVFSRLSPDGKIALRFPLLSGRLTEWEPSYRAIPTLVRMIWTTLDSLKMPGEYRQGKGLHPPLRLSPGNIAEHIRDALETTDPTVLIVPAAHLRNWSIWPQLSNRSIGQQRHKLILGNGAPVERDHPSRSNILGIVRYRGPDSEVPDYFPVSDRVGTARDYLAAQGWFTTDDQFVRYFGVGVTQSTSTNRETIHHDAHSLLHSKRQRPSGAEVEVGAAHRYAHARLIEFVPFFVSPTLGEQGPLAICRLAQVTRMMGWHTPTLSLPWPAHVATTAMTDALDVVARYSDV